jgi:Fe-S-cluster containining protein
MPAHGRSRLAKLARKTDQWFDRASAALLGQVPCRAGCSHCCIGLFPVTRLDADLLHEGLAQLPVDKRTLIQQRATAQVSALKATYPKLSASGSLDGWSDGEIDQAVSRFDRDRCPALSDDGLCSVYAYRPLVCRSMGIPTEAGDMVEGACSVQTFVPIVRLSASLRAEEQELADWEAEELAEHRAAIEGQEILLPYSFL